LIESKSCLIKSVGYRNFYISYIVVFLVSVKAIIALCAVVAFFIGKFVLK